jgi:hypothetical protein
LTYCHLEKFLRRLVGRTDIEDALLRLEIVTLEEARMAAAESLKAIHGVGTNVQDTLKAMEDRMRGMEGILQGVGDRLQGVDDRGKNMGDDVIISEQTVTVSLVITGLIVYADRCRENRTTITKRP